jgi:nitrogen fixation/metabolism regulation signal transduction histidine kinase
MPAPKFETVDFAKIVKEAVFLQSNSNKNIKFHMLLNSGNSYVAYIDPFQINQVLINLLQNSINSIIESSKAGNVYVSLSTSKDNGYNLVVEDDGPGFSENALEHALDPYYTTRESGNGLGLAIVYKIIVEHGGVIELSNSEKHGGASVKIMLPSGS